MTARKYPFPALDMALIDALDGRYPAPKPRPGESKDQIMFDAGARSVVEKLLEEFQRQNRLIPGDS